MAVSCGNSMFGFLGVIRLDLENFHLYITFFEYKVHLASESVAYGFSKVWDMCGMVSCTGKEWLALSYT